MVDITKRSVKGSPLTNDEVDTNFDNLNTGKVGVEDIGTDPNQVPLNQYLGSMAYQDLDAVSITGGTVVVDSADINGGTIDGVTIGGASAGAGSFTTLTASSDVNFDSGTLFVDASADSVGIGTTSPGSKLHVSQSNSGNYASVVLLSNSANAAADRTGIYGSSAPGTASPYRGGITFWPGSLGAVSIHTGLNSSPGDGERFRIDSNGLLTNQIGAVFNESSADSDFRVESNNNANMLFVDAGNDRVGVGTSSPSQLLGFPYGGISSGTVQVTVSAAVEIPELTTKGAYFIIVRGSDSRQPVAIFTATKVDDTATGSITKLEESAGISFWAGKVWSLTWPAGDKPKLSHNYVGTIDARYIVFGIRM